MCETLKQMRNLLTLKICVHRLQYQTKTTYWNRRQPVEGDAPENRMLAQLIGVRARKECVVEVPWVRRVIGELPGAEFELREAEGAVDVVDESLLLRK